MTTASRRALFALSLALLSTQVLGNKVAPIEQVARQQVAPHHENAAVVDAIVQFRQAARVDTFRADLERLDAKRAAAMSADSDRTRIQHTYSRVLYGASIHVPRALLKDIKALPYVQSVHIARSFRTSGEPSAIQQLAKTIHANAATRGAGIVVAIIDTGVDYTHPALGEGFGAGFKVIGGWDFVNNDADPMDDHGHGTHVAGIIAADGDGLLGVAPDVSLLAYKVLDSNGSGNEADVIAGIDRTVDPDGNGDPADHVDVVNMSLGSTATGDDPVATAVQNAIAAGVIFCVSAGNSGEYGNISSPAIAPAAITVGAADRNDKIAAFSSRGPSFDYGIKPELVAPGVDILSSVPNGGKLEASGTSMAAPYVAGVAALVKALHESWSPAEVKAAIVTSTATLAEDVMVAGAGRADVSAATNIATLALPSVVDFGQINTKQAVWTKSRTITLHNTSTEPQTFAATIAGLRDGVMVRAVPASVTIAPGASQTVSVEIEVTNSAVPAPRDGSRSYGGQVVWSGGAVPIHMPWAFVKAAFLTIEVTGNTEAVSANVLGDRFKWNSDLFGSTMRVFWRLEKVDVVVNERTPYDMRVALAEEVDLDASPMANFDMTASHYTLTTDTLDERGQPLVTTDRECAEKIVLSFPGKRKVSYEQSPDGSSPVYFPHVSSRVKIYPTITCGDSARDSVYVGMHEPLNGIEGNITSTLRPQWLRQDVEFAPENGTEKGLTIAFPTTRFPGPEFEFFMDGGTNYLMRETSSPLTIFFTRSPGPEVDLVTRVERWETCPNGGDCPVLSDMYLYLAPESVRADGDVFLNISPTAYELPRGTTMKFGDTPLWPYAGFAVNRGLWSFVSHWKGPLAEERGRETNTALSSAFAPDGTLLFSAPFGFQRLGTLEPGRYRLTSVVSDLTIAGVPGQATFTGFAEVGQSDAFLPIFTTLRIVDESERQVAKLARNAHGSLLFSAADNIHDENRVYVLRVPPREDATLVEYRQHGTSAWRPLPALVTARQYQNNSFLNGGVGTVYRVDLSAVTAELVGAVDLRVKIEDATGNTSELLLEPAFTIASGSGKRHAVRH
jgi:subtilisin family serine protease